MNMVLSEADVSSKLVELLPNHGQPADIAVWVIVGLFICGLIATIRGLYRTHKETVSLEEKSELSYAEMNELVEQENVSKKGFSDHIAQRIHAVLRGEQSHRIPTLTELHGVTQHSEFVRFYSSFSRTITSVLIICGIAGSVVGIHGVDFSGEMLNKLTAALKPSLWAVSCTVILVFMRGWYMHNFRQFLDRLDNVTTSNYMPLLSSHTTLDVTVIKLAETQKNLFGLVDGYGRLIKSVQDNMETWIQTRDLYMESSKEMRNCALKMEETMSHLNTSMARQNESFDLLKDTLSGLTDMHKDAVSKIGDMHNNQVILTTTTGDIVNALHNLRNENGEFATVLSSLVTLVQDSAIKNVEVAQTLGQTVSGVHEDLSSLEDTLDKVKRSAKTFDTNFSKASTSMEALEGTFKGVSGHIVIAGKSMADSSEKLAASVQTIEEDFVAIKDSIAEIRDSGTNFAMDIRKIDSNMRSLAELPDRLTQESKVLRKEMNISMIDLKRKLEDACSDLRKFHHLVREKESVSEVVLPSHVASATSVQQSRESSSLPANHSPIPQVPVIPPGQAVTANPEEAYCSGMSTPSIATIQPQTPVVPTENKKPVLPPPPIPPSEVLPVTSPAVTEIKPPALHHSVASSKQPWWKRLGR